MLPEIKNFNFSAQFNSLVKAGDQEMLEEAWTIAHLFTDGECIFRYDLADNVNIKSISCYLKQYWKAYWDNFDANVMLNAVVLDAMKDDGLIKYAPQYPDFVYQDFFDEMFNDMCSSKIRELENCPYAE